jgi:hypothetical protein
VAIFRPPQPTGFGSGVKRRIYGVVAGGFVAFRLQGLYDFSRPDFSTFALNDPDDSVLGWSGPPGGRSGLIDLNGVEAPQLANEISPMLRFGIGLLRDPTFVFQDRLSVLKLGRDVAGVGQIDLEMWLLIHPSLGS